MPTPMEILLDPLSLIVLALYVAFILWEALAPGRKLPKVKGWRLRGFSPVAGLFYSTPGKSFSATPAGFTLLQLF